MELGNILFGHSRGEIEVDRKYQDLFCAILTAIDPDDYHGTHYENDTFKMEPYCWCEREGCPQCGGDAPNFIYKPSGFKLSWYKYPLRDAYCNIELDSSEWQKMIYECVKSVKYETNTPLR